jgi:hypothetical protein
MCSVTTKPIEDRSLTLHVVHNPEKRERRAARHPAPDLQRRGAAGAAVPVRHLLGRLVRPERHSKSATLHSSFAARPYLQTKPPHMLLLPLWHIHLRCCICALQPWG